MEVRGYYFLYKTVMNLAAVSLICCGHLPGGYLQVAGNINCYILKVQSSIYQPVVDVKTSSKLAYNNYCQDLRTWQNYLAPRGVLS